ncbi:hypothetical protein V8C86DRAFT_2644201 [Haematococcus lacustris]
MLTMAGDGNCQFRTISFELFATQDMHLHVRRVVMEHIKSHHAEYECFLGEDMDAYITCMSRGGTWGDELTLRAACDAFGVLTHVVTSDAQNWYLKYQPANLKSDKEMFLTYIAPIHYNAIRRKSSLQLLTHSLGTSFKRLNRAASKRADASDIC